MIRLFIAIPIPQTIRVLLHAMGRSIHGCRPVPEEQIHITLRFIGEVDGTVFTDIREILSTVSIPPFSIRVKGVGHFPPRGKPRVIWAGIDRNEPLISLKRKVDMKLASCGIPADGRKFSPHITLARINSSSLDRITAFLSGNAMLEFDDFVSDEFHLYSSTLSHKGAIHTLEERYTLQSGSFP